MLYCRGWINAASGGKRTVHRLVFVVFYYNFMTISRIRNVYDDFHFVDEASKKKIIQNSRL